MKKRILSAILMSAVILTTTACGGNTVTEQQNSQQESEATSAITSAVTTEKQEQSEVTTTTSATSTALEETAEPLKLLNVKTDYGFVNNLWHFETDNGERYFYDITENTLINLDKIDEIDEYFWKNVGFFTTGDLIGCVNTLNEYSCAIDIKTNEYVLNSETDGCQIRATNCKSGLMLVTKVDEGFSGNTISIGVMNNKQEWEYPMTEFSIDGFTTDELNDCSYTLMGDYVLLMKSWNTGYIYSLKDKKISEIEKQVFYYQSYWNNDGDKVMSEGENGVWVIDSTGKITQIYPSKAYASFKGDGIVIQEDEKFTVLSCDNYKDMGFDLSGYDVTSIYDVKENVIAFSAKNPDGDTYTIIMNKDGSLVTDPIKGYYERLTFCGDYVVIDSKDTIIDCKTGDVKTFENIEYIYREVGVLVMKSEGLYYLAYPSDPDTLLNPFELVAQ